MNDPDRRTGRTTRMLKSALESDHDGIHFIVTANHVEAKRIAGELAIMMDEAGIAYTRNREHEFRCDDRTFKVSAVEDSRRHQGCHGAASVDHYVREMYLHSDGDARERMKEHMVNWTLLSDGRFS